MVIGAVDRGKSHLARYLVAGSPGAAMVSADVGQPSIGVPACLALALRRPWRTPETLWFVGDVTPVRHLLPIVVGTARLAERARAAGARLVVIDTSGLVDGPIGRLFKYHKAVAAQVTDVVAVEQDDELASLVVLLERVARVHRVAPAPVARERGRDERRVYRERAFRAHLRGAGVIRFDRRRVIGPTWSRMAPDEPVEGTLVGLIDREGFCRRLGVVSTVRPHVIEVRVRHPRPGTITSLRLGTLRVTRTGEELRR